MVASTDKGSKEERNRNDPNPSSFRSNS